MGALADVRPSGSRRRALGDAGAVGRVAHRTGAPRAPGAAAHAAAGRHARGAGADDRSDHAFRNAVRFAQEKVERKLVWFDWATQVGLSADARLMAFTESGRRRRRKCGVYVRPTDGSPAIRVGDRIRSRDLARWQVGGRPVRRWP